MVTPQERKRPSYAAERTQWHPDPDADGLFVCAQDVMLDGRRWSVRSSWNVVAGRLEPIAVEIISPDPDEPLVANAIRRLPLGSMLRYARKRFTGAEIGLQVSRPDLTERIEEFAAAAAAGSHRGIASSPEELEAVAAVYRLAWGEGEPVTEAVARHFHISKSTAGKRIMRARAAGLLDDVRRITR